MDKQNTISSALKMAALMTEEYLEEQARRADPADELESVPGGGQPHTRLQPTKVRKRSMSQSTSRSRLRG